MLGRLPPDFQSPEFLRPRRASVLNNFAMLRFWKTNDKIGSSNANNRSMSFDTECDVGVETSSEPESTLIRDFTHSLVGEPLNCTLDAVRAAWREHGSLLR